MLLTISTVMVTSTLLYRWKKNNMESKQKKRRLNDKHSIRRAMVLRKSLLQTQATKTLTVAQNERDSSESESERNSSRYFAVALGSMGCAAVGKLLYPPLNVVSAIGLIYVSLPFGKEAYTTLITEKKIRKKINMSSIDTMLAVLCISNGYYFAWSWGCSFIYGGKKLLNKTKDHSKNNLFDTFGQQSRYVYIQQDGVDVSVLLESLQIGDIVVVMTGETIPVDGVITEGIASIDQQILTGESQPVEKEAGDGVFASTVVLRGRICIRVEKAGTETTTAQIAEILTDTADFKSTVVSRGEIYANRSTLPTFGIASVAFLSTGSLAAVTILNAAYGYHLRMLAPIGTLKFLSHALQQGILIKDGRVLDVFSQIDTVVFDKTGTLTKEQPHVGCIYSCSAYTEQEILSYATAAEYKQTHPIAMAILQAAKREQLVIPSVDDSDYKVGYGLTVKLDNALIIRVGSIRFMQMEGIHIPEVINKTQTAAHDQGFSLMMVGINDELAGAIELRSTVRPEAKEVVDQLKAMNKAVYIISGDNEIPTKRLADELGISHYFAETLPEDKASLITQLQDEGRCVCYMGDGINDSIALKKAQVSISLRGASTIATDTAQVVFMDNSISQLIPLFALAEKFDTGMKTVLVTTMIPSVVTITGVFFWHFGIIQSIILNQTGFAAGLLNVLKDQKNPEIPAIEANKKQIKK